MRMLWTAELQARQFGVRGSTDPLDNAQLPLLATMQFDGFTNQGPALRQSHKAGQAPWVLLGIGKEVSRWYEDSGLTCTPSLCVRGEKVFKLVKWPKDFGNMCMYIYIYICVSIHIYIPGYTCVNIYIYI